MNLIRLFTWNTLFDMRMWYSSMGQASAENYWQRSPETFTQRLATVTKKKNTSTFTINKFFFLLRWHHGLHNHAFDFSLHSSYENLIVKYVLWKSIDEWESVFDEWAGLIAEFNHNNVECAWNFEILFSK